MLEETIANFIDSNTSLTVGVDLGIGELVDTTKEGAVVVFNRDIPSYDGFDHAVIQVLLFYFDYVAARTLQNALSDLFNEYRGCSGNAWAVADDITLDNFGLDALGRNVLSLSIEIIYKEA